MCASMVDIQSPTAEIRRGKKESRKKKPQDENMTASAMQSGHKKTIIKLKLATHDTVHGRCDQYG